MVEPHVLLTDLNVYVNHCAMVQPLGCISDVLGFIQTVWVPLALISASVDKSSSAGSSQWVPPLRKAGLIVSKRRKG